jgi:hypothetical protein
LSAAAFLAPNEVEDDEDEEDDEGKAGSENTAQK